MTEKELLPVHCLINGGIVEVMAYDLETVQDAFNKKPIAEQAHCRIITRVPQPPKYAPSGARLYIKASQPAPGPALAAQPGNFSPIGSDRPVGNDAENEALCPYCQNHFVKKTRWQINCGADVCRQQHNAALGADWRRKHAGYMQAYYTRTKFAATANTHKMPWGAK